jgi:hypothetical protein
MLDGCGVWRLGWFALGEGEMDRDGVACARINALGGSDISRPIGA